MRRILICSVAALAVTGWLTGAAGAAATAKKPPTAPYKTYLAKTDVLMRKATAAQNKLVQITLSTNEQNAATYPARLRTIRDEFSRLAAGFAALKTPAPLRAGHAKAVRSLRLVSSAIERFAKAVEAFLAAPDNNRLSQAITGAAASVSEALKLQNSWAAAVRASPRGTASAGLAGAHQAPPARSAAGPFRPGRKL